MNSSCNCSPQGGVRIWTPLIQRARAVEIRAGVERGFATMKRHDGYRRVRYLGLARNRCHLNLMCAAINLRRALVLAA